MDILKQLDSDLENSFRKIVSNGWKLLNTTYPTENFKKLDDEQNRLQNYYKAIQLIKEICFSNITPSGKISLKGINNELIAIEKKAINNENYELAHISQFYSKLLRIN